MDCSILDGMPHVTSGVGRFLITGRGTAEGMILTNGLEVHFPAYLSARILSAVRVGDRVTIYGLHPKASTLMLAKAVQASDGTLIVDEGLPTSNHRSSFGALRAALSDRIQRWSMPGAALWTRQDSTLRHR